MGCLLFSVGEEWLSRLMPIPSGIFGAVNLMKFNIVHLLLVLRMILLIWFSKVRKCLQSTASPLCYLILIQYFRLENIGFGEDVPDFSLAACFFRSFS